MERDVAKEIRTELGLADYGKRENLKKNLLKAGVVAGAVVALSSGVNATSIFYRDEQGNETDLKNQTVTQVKVLTFPISGLKDISGTQTLILMNTKGYLQIPFSGTIVSWYVFEVSDTPIAGSIVIDVWKDTTGNYPPTVGDTIAGSQKPTLSSQTNANNINLNTWTTNITAGDVIGFNVDSVTNCKNIILQIKVNV
jgi:hypothetical protein